MASSTSPSNPAVPWLAVRLLGVALAAWVVGAIYTLRVNPEIAFFRRGHAVKQSWAKTLEPQPPPKIVVFGGSSCATSVDGERLLREHGLPVLNLGLGAGMGAKVLTRYALPVLRPGDTLIMAMESDLMTGPLTIPTLGVQFSLATGQWNLLRDPDRVDWSTSLLSLRPGGYHGFTLLGKILLRQPLYRYSPDEFHASGWHEVVVKRPIPDPVASASRLSEDMKVWLIFIRDFCAQRGVRVAYTLPWGYCPPEQLAAYHRDNARFLQQVAEFLPVLKEPSLGAHSVREHYADTSLHLTATGAALRTDELARQIKAWSTWSPAELAQRIASEPAAP